MRDKESALALERNVQKLVHDVHEHGSGRQRERCRGDERNAETVMQRARQRDVEDQAEQARPEEAREGGAREDAHARAPSGWRRPPHPTAS